MNTSLYSVAQPPWTAAACCRFPTRSLLRSAHESATGWQQQAQARKLISSQHAPAQHIVVPQQAASTKAAAGCRSPRIGFATLVLMLLCLAGAQADDWQQAPHPYEPTFPADHGQHPNQRIEWWYFTGNVAAADGHAFGYQLTFFRIGTEFKPANPSAWAVRDLHMAHFAISDLTDGKYFCAQRLGRTGPGLSGAAADNLKVWQGTWQAELQQDVVSLSANGQDAGQDFKLDLKLETRGPFVKHGENGYSRKGVLPGNASIYYSFTRMPSTGTIVLGKQSFPVAGQSWMDHEFGTSFLEPGQVGWDWFALQLDDGSDLMVYRIRSALPSSPPNLSGTLVNPDGSTTKLTASDIKLKSSETWKSATTSGTYPLHWEINLPGQEGALMVTTKLSAQEMHGGMAGPSYWEGAVEAAGTLHGKKVNGKGYLEMTGYSEGMASFFSMGK